MKIYKLDVNVAKPVSKVVQMQQNSAGVLSVDVSNDGKYIRNLSCALYDGGAEASALSGGDNFVGFKLDVGAQPKHVKIVAKSEPLTTPSMYVVDRGSGRPQTVWLTKLYIPAGTYTQDEFMPYVKNYEGIVYPVTLAPAPLSAANFDKLMIAPWLPNQKLFFTNNNAEVLPQDAPIVVTGNGVSCGI